MPARKYSDELLDEAAQLREKGLSYEQIARRLGMSNGAVYWHCLRLGADRPDARPLKSRADGPPVVARSGHVVRRFSETEDAILREMSLRGDRVAMMARKLNRPYNSVMGRLMTLARHDARREDHEGAE